MSRVWRGVKLLFWLGVAGLILMAALITVVMLLPESAQRAD